MQAVAFSVDSESHASQEVRDVPMCPPHSDN
jgi:hypothetical protein